MYVCMYVIKVRIFKDQCLFVEVEEYWGGGGGGEGEFLPQNDVRGSSEEIP